MNSLIKPKVSIIIPAYNEQDYIERTLHSIKTQKYPNTEVIVVSNGSSDKTAEISGLYTSHVYEIRERGIPKAKNLGIEKCSGDIITFLDADSSMEETLIDKAINALMQYYSGGKAKIIPDDKSLAAKLYHDYVNFCSDLSQFLTYFSKNMLNGAGAFMFTDRYHIEKLKWKYGKVFDESLETMTDVDFLRKLRKEGPLKFIKDSHIITSTRRFNNEGYLKRFIIDYLEYLFPKSKKRIAHR